MAAVTASEPAEAHLKIFGIVSERREATTRTAEVFRNEAVVEGDKPVRLSEEPAYLSKSRAVWDCCPKWEVNSS